MFISEEKLQQIKEANPIEEVIGEFLPLKKVGKNYRTLCPFHSEKEPSFTVSPEKGIYFCFGCHRGGNVITFLMEYKGMNFIEAVKYLADRAGITVEVSQQELPNKELYEACEFAAKFYHQVLLSQDGEIGMKYLKKRGIKDESISEFMLGYAPYADKHALVEHAKIAGISLETLERCGLVLKHGEEYIDRFRLKVIFPIRDALGRYIGFGTRVLDQSEPKYINSPETDIFKKRFNLYGFYEAKSYIKRLEHCILVEGYIDLIRMHEYGFKNSVASLGTAFTQEQANLIARYTSCLLYTSPSPRD